MRASKDQGRGSGIQSSASEPIGGLIASNSSESIEEPSSSTSTTTNSKGNISQGGSSSSKGVVVVKGQSQQQRPSDRQIRPEVQPSIQLQLVPFVPHVYVGGHHPQQCRNPCHSAASSARGQRVLRERGHQNSGGSSVRGSGVFSSTTRNQVILVGGCYCYTSTSTVTNSSVVVLTGSPQGTMDRNHFGFSSQPSSQGYDTVNGFPSGQQGGGAGGYQPQQMQPPQQSSSMGYNGQMPMGGRGSGSYGLVISQNHAVNHNFYFTSPGSYDVSVQAPAVAAPHGNRVGGFGAAGQGWQGQVPHGHGYGYQDAHGYRTFQTPGSAFVPIATTGPRASADWPRALSTSGDQTPPSRTRPRSMNAASGNSPSPTVGGQQYFQPSNSQPQPQFGHLPVANSFRAHRGRLSSFQNSSASLSQGSLDNYDDLLDEDQENNAGTPSGKSAFNFPSQFRDRF